MKHITVYSIEFTIGLKPRRAQRQWYADEGAAEGAKMALETNPAIKCSEVRKHVMQANCRGLISILNTYACTGDPNVR